MKSVRRNRMHLSSVAAMLVACGLAQGAEIIVPTQMSLSVALASAADGDTITILPSGSPYSQYPGFSFTGKHLHIRGSTGNPADVVLDGANLDRVLSISGAAADGTTLEAITIQHGRGPATSEANGAGLYINDSNVTILNCIIRDNVMPGAEGNGAGLYAFASSIVTVQNTIFQGNTITGGNGDGAGAFLTTATGIFENCQFNSNIAEATLSDDSSWGGALYLDNGSFRFTRCTFDGNKAELGGALYVTGTGILTVDATRFSGNLARYGGGIYMNTGSAVPTVIRNSLFLNNATNINGCAVQINKAASIMNCTFVGNVATGNYILDCNAASRTVLTVDNCIIWGNTAGAISPISGTNAPILRRNIVQVAYTVANGSGYNAVADPLFKAAGDYHLQAGSPAIDAGDTTLYSGPLADYDGNTRGVEIASPSHSGYSIFGPVIDLGAYEFGATCYANCDESTAPPILNVNDFQCFINKFAVGCT